MALVVKHTFLEYRPPNDATADDCIDETRRYGSEHDLEVRGGRRARSFSDSEIDYCKSDSLYNSDGVESCETESTCLDAASLSEAVGSTSSASSSGGDGPEGKLTTDFPNSLELTPREVRSSSWADCPNSPELTPREVRSSSWEYGETACGQESHEEEKLKSRVIELTSEACELMAKALRAEEEAQQLRMKANALWYQFDVDATAPMNAMPVQIMQWVPMSYVTPAMSDAVNCETIPVTVASKPNSRRQIKGKSTNASTVRTTLMMRNIPNNYTRDMLLDLLDSEGFTGCYDFVYLPVDYQRLSGLGYVFVNFTTTEAAEWAKLHFQGFDRWAMTSPKVCDMVWGEPLQGLDVHIERYRNSPVMHEDVPEQYKPVYLQGGVRQPFPAPTKRIRPPRIKRGGVPGMLPDFSRANVA